MKTKLVRDVGEKALLRTLIKPLFNPTNEPDLVGDDCAVLKVPDQHAVCLSTDRVPADLISFRLRLIDYGQLGYYLAILNFSDLAAMGATPLGLLLNFGLPGSLPVASLEELVRGVQNACNNYECAVLGGDLSDSADLSLSATAVGHARHDRLLRRLGARGGDIVYCTDVVGTTPTSFAYFLEARPKGFRLSEEEERLLCEPFRHPRARVSAAKAIAAAGLGATAMDNTDGVAQTLFELAEINGCSIILEAASLRIPTVTEKVARFLGISALDLALRPGADFQLLGTLSQEADPTRLNQLPVQIIGRMESGPPAIALKTEGGLVPHVVRGWDYYIPPIGAVP